MLNNELKVEVSDTTKMIVAQKLVTKIKTINHKYGNLKFPEAG